MKQAFGNDVIRAAEATLAEGWPYHFVSNPRLVRDSIQALPGEHWHANPWLLTGLAVSYWQSSEPVERAAAAVYFKEARRLTKLDHDIPVQQRLVMALHHVAYQRGRGRFKQALVELGALEKALEKTGEVPFEWRLGFETRIRLERAQLDWHSADFDAGEARVAPVLAMMAQSRLLPHEQVTAYGVAALYSLIAEDYGRVDSWVEQAIQVAENSDGELRLFETGAMAPAMFARAMTELERANFALASSLAMPLEATAHLNEWQPYVSLWEAARFLLERKPREALEPLRRARLATHRWSGATLLDSLSSSIRVGIDTGLGRSTGQGATLGGFHQDARHVFCEGQYTGWLHISAGRYQDAIASVAACIQLGDDHARGSLTDVLLIDAVARYAAGDQVDSATSFDYALNLCAESGFRRAFHHVPPSVLRPMLSSAASRSHSEAVDALLAEFAETFDAEEAEELPRLSEREYEILRGLQMGLPVRELAQKLFISQNTMKTHVRNIYRKLGVASRTDALIVARRLGITLESPEI